MKLTLAFLPCVFLAIALHAQNPIAEYIAAHPDDGKPSQSTGTVSNGALLNGKLIPFAGDNFHYFDTTSYLHGRAFVHKRVRDAVLTAYAHLARVRKDRQFVIMECANEKGGRMMPHRTHQNGMSVDFMMPLTKAGAPFDSLDRMEAEHYLLEFDAQGRWALDNAVRIDFELVAHHLLTLEAAAKESGLRISKVIIKIELKDELYAGVYGQELKRSGIYVVQNLTPLINALHDDHYHVDFEPLK